MKETAPRGPMRTVQERRSAGAAGTLVESQPAHRGTLAEARPGGADEVFVAADSDFSAGASRSRGGVAQWLKTPAGIATAAGGVVGLMVAVVAVALIVGSGEEPKSDASEKVASAPAEEIPAKPAEEKSKRKSDVKKAKAAANGSAHDSHATLSPSDLAALVDAVSPSVVRIEAQLPVGSKSGSGLVVDAGGGLIATNQHVVEGARKVTATFADGTTREMEGFRLHAPEKDLAILQLAKPTGSLTVAPLAVSLPKKGDVAASVGPGKGLAAAPAQGAVEEVSSGPELSQQGLKSKGTWIETTAALTPRLSGGPLVSRNGLVIGLSTWTSSAGQNQGFAISAVDLRAAIDSARQSELDPLPAFRSKMDKPKRRQFAGPFRTTPNMFGALEAKEFTELWFGADGFDLSKQNALQLRRAGLKRTNSGFFLKVVAYGSPAYTAGLRERDILKKVNGKFISSTDELSKVVNAARPGQALKVEALKFAGVFAGKGRYQPRPKNYTVTIQAVVPHSAIDYVAQQDGPDPVKEYLLLQLLNYAQRLKEATERATGGGKFDQQNVDRLQEAGPFDGQLAPSLAGNSSLQLGTIGRADGVRILEVIEGGHVRFKVQGRDMLMAVDVAGYGEGAAASFGVVQIVDTKSYTTEDGESKRAFVAERFNIAPFLPSGATVPAASGGRLGPIGRQLPASSSVNSGSGGHVSPQRNVVRGNPAAAGANLSGIWRSSNNGSLLRIDDKGKTLDVRLVWSKDIQELNGTLIRNGNVLMSQKWQGVFKADPSLTRRDLQLQATVIGNDAISTRFTNVRWDGRGRETSRQFNGRGVWTRLSEEAAEAALDALDDLED